MIDEIALQIVLAQMYFNDGAPRTAAERLRAAAELLDMVADRRDQTLREMGL